VHGSSFRVGQRWDEQFWHPTAPELHPHCCLQPPPSTTDLHAGVLLLHRLPTALSARRSAVLICTRPPQHHAQHICAFSPTEETNFPLIMFIPSCLFFFYSLQIPAGAALALLVVTAYSVRTEQPSRSHSSLLQSLPCSHACPALHRPGAAGVVHIQLHWGHTCLPAALTALPSHTASAFQLPTPKDPWHGQLQLTAAKSGGEKKDLAFSAPFLRNPHWIA